MKRTKNKLKYFKNTEHTTMPSSIKLTNINIICSAGPYMKNIFYKAIHGAIFLFTGPYMRSSFSTAPCVKIIFTEPYMSNIFNFAIREEHTCRAT